MSFSSTPSHTASSGIFRLLVQVDSNSPVDQPFLEIHGSRWILTKGSDLPDHEETPNYTCISYAWGDGKMTHPFEESRLISDRAMTVLETVIRIQKPDALWVDAFCVPFEESARVTCLSNMGRIYNRAAQVVVVLSEPCSILFEQIREQGYINEATLLTFEKDTWITRVWNYQEIVNSNHVHFVAEGGSNACVDAEKLLSNVGFAINKFKKTHGYDSFEYPTKHPRLNSMEDLILDWKMSGYLKRTAYQVLSSMNQRKSDQSEDHYWAMIGAISDDSDAMAGNKKIHPAEYFMQLCEAKGDFSFIYSTAPRSNVPGKRWRPKAMGRFEAIFSWHAWGKGQPGRLFPDYIQLDELWKVTPGAIGSVAKTFIAEWLKTDIANLSPESMPAHILKGLRLACFSGCGEYLETEDGYFFPHLPIHQGQKVFVAVATGLGMALGAPGLLLKQNGPDLFECCGVGLFIGPVPKSGEIMKVS